MKRIYLPLSALLLSASLLAQTPANRTAQTTVADVLAQLPAARVNQYNKLMGELSETGEAGVLYMVSLMNPPGKGSNEQVDYALSGLSHFVMEEGKESLRSTVANAYIKALGTTSDEETKKFIIRQLQIVGQDESVDPLAGNLSDASLSGPSARALATIGTPKAIGALRTALLQDNLQGKTLNDVILAIGESATPDAAYEPALTRVLNAADEDTQKAAYYTLGRVGTVSSLKTLAQAAEKAGYKMDKAGATEAYILLLKNLAANGQSKEAEKAATDLLKKATKANQTHARIAALDILLSIQQENGLKQVVAAMKDGNKEYRNAALNFTSCFATQPVYVELMKTAIKAKPDVKVDIVNWIGREATCPEKNPVLKNLEVRFDLSAKDALLKMVDESDFQVKQAAVWALVKIGDANNIPEIARLLTSSDPQTVLLAQDALMAYKGDISPAVARVIPQASDAGKIAAVELLAHRKASANLNTVLELVRSGSPEVKQAAYKGLKDVVAEKDMIQIAGMLESAEKENVPALQEAVISSLKTLAPADQVKTVSRRMVEAGEGKKYLYYSVLAATGDPEALPTIVTGFNTGNTEAKDAAFEALLRWRGTEAADELYAIASQSSSGSYADRALERYIVLVSNPSITGENRLLSLRKAMDIARTDAQKNQILQRVQRTGTYLGLLFAGEYLDQKPLQQSAAQAVMNIALENEDYNGRNVRELLNKVIQVLDNPDADYQREAIRKYLAEVPDEEGYVSLFNGKDLSGWKGLVGNPISRSKMSPGRLVAAQEKADEQMRKDWKVENGLLVFDGTGYDNLCTVKQYGDFEMYVDWKLDADGPEPDGGIYLRGTPQVQFWDISRTNVGAQVGSGGLYNNQTHPSDPLKVADNKLGEWNTFYIKMVGDRVTVKLNGELVTDDVILENYWDRKQPIFPVEQLELQAHGSKVYYRNIYVKELERPEPFQLSDQEKKEGYKILFDGTNMHQWVGNTVDYTLDNGTISMIPSRSFGGNLYTKEEYGNFIIRFEFQLTPAANNGLGIRTPMEGDAAYVGMELQILDNEHPVYKDLHEYQYHGSVYGIIPAKRGFLKPVGEWNYQEVIADGDNIKITLNGEVILDGNIREAVKNGTPDGKEHPGLFNKKGHIGFLGHGSPVKFRNIRIKELK